LIYLFIYIHIHIYIYTKHTINTCVFGVTFFQPLELPDTMAKGKSPRAPSKERGEVHGFDWGCNFWTGMARGKWMNMMGK